MRATLEGAGEVRAGCKQCSGDWRGAGSALSDAVLFQSATSNASTVACIDRNGVGVRAWFLDPYLKAGNEPSPCCRAAGGVAEGPLAASAAALRTGSL